MSCMCIVCIACARPPPNARALVYMRLCRERRVFGVHITFHLSAFDVLYGRLGVLAFADLS